MKPKSLRLGNLFKEKHSGKIIKVKKLSKKKITFSGKFKDEWQAEPIYLNKETMLHLTFCGLSIEEFTSPNHGRGKSTDSYVFRNTIEGIFDLEIHVLYNFFRSGLEMEFCISIGKYKGQEGKVFKYLHELQNEVYSITEKEIKLHKNE